MINKELIASLIKERLEEDGVFLVEIRVSPTKCIYVEVDSLEGVNINYCMTLSKFIESHLDRDEEDFELEISTSSISAPFKVLEHYEKNLGSEVEILTKDNKKIVGILTAYSDDDFTLEISTMEKVDGKKKKQLVVRTETYAYGDVNTTKLVLKFK